MSHAHNLDSASVVAHPPAGAAVTALDELRQLAEDALQAFARERLAGRGGAVEPLGEAINYSLLAPGKRLRPTLVMAAADSCGVTPAASVGVAIAFELVHTYSLVHDDLPSMDDDDLRRGLPTSHRRYGEGVATLVGDALQAEAYELLARARGFEDTQLLDIVRLLASATGRSGMVGGQFLDIATRRSSGDIGALRQLHALKTGALLSACTEAGAVLGGADESERHGYARFGRELGWLFQLVDDLLDELGTEAETGKTAGSDRRAHKVTAIDVFGIDGTRQAADQQLETCLQLAASLRNGGGLLPDIAAYVRERRR